MGTRYFFYTSKNFIYSVIKNKILIYLRECKGNIFIKSDKFIFKYFNKLLLLILFTF